MGYSVMNVAGGREDSRYMAPTARILIVEDDAIVARDLKSSLTKMGYFVTDVPALAARHWIWWPPIAPIWC